MTQDRKRKVLVYKRVRFHTKPGTGLSTLLTRALQSHATIGERREPLAPTGESPVWRLIGEYQVEKSFVFGVLMRYTPGLHPACMVDDQNAKTVTVQQLQVPATQDGKPQELLSDMLYFACMDDHLVLMQSSALRAKGLEMHLQWLLHQASVLEGTNTLFLDDRPTSKAAQAMRDHAVREVDIGGELLSVDDEPTAEPGRASAGAAAAAVAAGPEPGQITLREGGAGRSVLATIKSLMSKDQAAKLDTDALLGSNIEYTLTIRYNRSTTDDGQKLLNSLGSALRSAPGVSATIHLANGDTIKGDQLKIAGPVTITHYDGVPSSVEVFEEMRKWLLDKVKSEEVPA